MPRSIQLHCICGSVYVATQKKHVELGLINIDQGGGGGGVGDGCYLNNSVSVEELSADSCPAEI